MSSLFSLFFIVLAIRLMNKHLNKDVVQTNDIENPNQGENKIINYLPLIFHLTIISLILISCFKSGLMSEARISLLISDGIFQFVSTMLIYIITLINPFLSISPEMKERIRHKAQEQDFQWLNLLLKNKNWQLLKGLACIAIVWCCVDRGYLAIPDLSQGILSGITLMLIIFFIFGNIVQLIKDPVLFKQKTLFRLSMLYRSFKLSFLISIGLLLTIFILISILKIESTHKNLSMGMILLVYNVVMAYNEYKIVRS